MKPGNEKYFQRIKETQATDFLMVFYNNKQLVILMHISNNTQFYSQTQNSSNFN